MAKTFTPEQERRCRTIVQYWRYDLKERERLTVERTNLTNEVFDLRDQVSELRQKLDNLGSLPLTAGRRIGLGAVGIAAEVAIARRRGQLEDQLRRARQSLAGKEREMERAKRDWVQFDNLVGQSVSSWRANGCEGVYPRPA